VGPLCYPGAADAPKFKDFILPLVFFNACLTRLRLIEEQSDRHSSGSKASAPVEV
jgi:hypothetical protein